eukprot:2001062-Rhodomonas_salina.1
MPAPGPASGLVHRKEVDLQPDLEHAVGQYRSWRIILPVHVGAYSGLIPGTTAQHVVLRHTTGWYWGWRREIGLTRRHIGTNDSSTVPSRETAGSSIQELSTAHGVARYRS